MKLAKYLTILVVLILAAYSASWYYIMNDIATQVNEDFANKKQFIKGMSGDEYYTTFSKASPAGFPLKFQLKVEGWKEESATAMIDYNDPIYAGYDLAKQKIVISYDGEVVAAYKPVKNKFGAKFDVSKYFITIDLPITSDLFETLKKMQDPFEIVNHFGKIKVGTGKVKIYDLNDQAKFYDKEYEQLNFTFKARKYYLSIDDFKENIPTKYVFDYVVKTNPVIEPSRRLPVSLFYGFLTYPSDFYAVGNAEITTQAKNFDTIANDLDVKVNLKFTSPFFDMNSHKFEYRSLIDKNIPAFDIHNDMKFKLKKGAFDKLFRQYGIIRPTLIESGIGKLINREIEYIIENRNAFKFDELEDGNYEANIKAQGSDTKHRRFVKIENLSIFSETSGMKTSAESTFTKSNMIKGTPERVKANGILYVKNYPAVVEFSSGYIYRFGKFRFLNDDTRKLYVKVNKKFLKKISDHPNSQSEDLSFEFDIDSSNYSKAKFGSINFEQIAHLYQAELLKILIEHVGTDGDFVKRMQEIVPDLDVNSPILQKALPKLKQLQNLDKGLPKELEKAIPEDAQEAIKKMVPGGLDKKINKKLWKNLLQ